MIEYFTYDAFAHLGSYSTLVTGQWGRTEMWCSRKPNDAPAENCDTYNIKSQTKLKTPTSPSTVDEFLKISLELYPGNFENGFY